jgi:aminoglycoside phosphotransferase (APT) family kinase protein
LEQVQISTKPTAEAAFDILQLACPGLQVSEVKPGPSGYSSSLWVADTDEGALLVRIPLRNSSPRHLRATVAATRLANEAGVPTVRFRALLAESPYGPALVQEFRPGQRASDFLKQQPNRLKAVAEAAGHWIGLLHGVRRARFGEIVGRGAGADWRGCALGRIGRAIQAAPKTALPEPAQRVEALFSELLGQLDGEHPASLTHGDLYFDNVLVDDEGRPVCLLDFEHAGFLDRFAEFGKLNELMFEWWPGCETHFMAAYHQAFAPARSDALRRRIGVGLYELQQLAYFSRWQQDLVPVYRDRLAAWMASPSEP